MRCKPETVHGLGGGKRVAGRLFIVIISHIILTLLIYHPSILIPVFIIIKSVPAGTSASEINWNTGFVVNHAQLRINLKYSFMEYY